MNINPARGFAPIFVVLAGFLALVVIGGGTYYLFTRSAAPKLPEKIATTTPSTHQPQVSSDIASTSTKDTAARTFAVSPLSGAPPLTVTFDLPPSGKIQSIEFGDDTRIVTCASDDAVCKQTYTLNAAGGLHATHTYTIPGTYRVVGYFDYSTFDFATATISVHAPIVPSALAATIDQSAITATTGEFADYDISFSGTATGTDEVQIILVPKSDTNTADFNTLNHEYCGAGQEVVTEAVALWCQHVPVINGHWKDEAGAFANETDLIVHVFTYTGLPLTTQDLKVTYPPLGR